MKKKEGFLRRTIKRRCGGRFLPDRQETIGGWLVSPTFLNYIRTDIYAYLYEELDGKAEMAITPTLEDIELVVLALKARGLLYPGIEEVR